MNQSDESVEDQQQRKIRSDAGKPRMWERDIDAFRWMGEQGAASADNLQELLGREAAGPTNEPGRLSKTRIRHIIEEHWSPAGMIYWDTMMGRKWVWPTKRALQRAGLPFAPHRPADVNLNHLHHCNRIRLYLERLYSPLDLPGNWESERMIERSKKEWKARKKADSGISIPSKYRMWHQPDGVWTFRNRGDIQDVYAFVEVEVSAKRPEKLVDILLDLARHGTTWYYVDMDPKKGVYVALMEGLNMLEDGLGHFYFYDLAEPTKLVYSREQKKKSG